jgi:gas vesicle protein
MDRDDLASFLVGIGVGVVAGMLFAPQAGAETRGLLMDRAGRGRDYLRDRSGSLKDSASELIERGREMMNRQRDHLREAIDAGKQAYRDTVSRETENPGTNPNPTMY